MPVASGWLAWATGSRRWPHRSALCPAARLPSERRALPKQHEPAERRGHRHEARPAPATSSAEKPETHRIRTRPPRRPPPREAERRGQGARERQLAFKRHSSVFGLRHTAASADDPSHGGFSQLSYGARLALPISAWAQTAAVVGTRRCRLQTLPLVLLRDA